MNIAMQACTANNFDEAQTAETMTMLTIALYDGFISCWTNKYMHNTIRPETYIQELINPKFEPFIQTPPFPEYPSGHSCVSAAAATILTYYIPQPYTYADYSLQYLSIAPRYFNSFIDAANEASISRFYGGIHFMPALTNGALQGKNVANYILKKIKTKSIEK
jgi:hypothetical protein